MDILHVINNENPGVLKEMLESGDYINEEDHHGEKYLGYAAYVGNLDAARLLLDAGAKADYSHVNTAVVTSYAYKNIGKHMAIARLLMDFVDLNSSLGCWHGRSPLHYAAWTGRIDLMERLMGLGANINDQDENGTTPLMLAVLGGDARAVRFLLESGADRSIKNTEGKVSMDFVWSGEEMVGVLG